MLGGKPLVKSVKVVMVVVPVSLRHQHYYNFRKKQLENSEWTGAGVYTWGFTVSYLPGAPCKGVNYTCLRARGRCPLLIWSSLNTIRSWTLDRWMSGALVAGVTPLACLASLPHPQMCPTLHWQLFSAQHSLFTPDTVTNWARLTFVECFSSIPTCLIVCSSLWGIKNFHVVFPNSFRERVTKTGIFQLLSKMLKMLLPK